MSKKIAVAINGLEIYVDIENEHQEKKEWRVRLPDNNLVKMNNDGESFRSPSHGLDFRFK